MTGPLVDELVGVMGPLVGELMGAWTDRVKGLVG